LVLGQAVGETVYLIEVLGKTSNDQFSGVHSLTSMWWLCTHHPER
jgi:hypothetical protein